MCTLPEGFRPKHAFHAWMTSQGGGGGNGVACVAIRSDGTVALDWIIAHDDPGTWRWVIGECVYMTV